MALTAALQIAEPPFLLGLMQAIGERGDARAAPALVGAIRDPDAAVRRAGFEALAALPDPASLTAIRQALQDNILEALDGLLALGLNAGERGRPELAREVWRIASSRTELTNAQHCRLLHLLPYLNPEERDADMLARLMMSTARRGPRQVGCLMDALAGLPGRDATMVLVELVERSLCHSDDEAVGAGADQAALTVELIEALGRRGDLAALPVLEKLKRADDARARVAAERASARLKARQHAAGASATHPEGS